MTIPAHWRDLGPGIYLHVPFCRHRCGYCDFATTTGGEQARAAYVTDLCAEIGLTAASGEFAGAVFRTVFLGGGTPSILEPEQLARIFAALRASFAIAPDAEITLEANPESLEPAVVDGFLAVGGNRVSLGVQSLDDGLLRRLERVHDAALARRRAAELRARKIPFSIDLIYGLPAAWIAGPGEQAAAGLDSWARTVDAALALGSDHLSAYLLGLEPGTPMHAAMTKGQLGPVGDEEARGQYELLVERAEGAGLACYEISNFARPGRESRHNQNYWVRGDYLGLGPSAHSHRAGTRWANERGLAGWSGAIREGRRPVASSETIGSSQGTDEWIFLGLRRSEGVPWRLLAEEAGEGAASLSARVEALTRAGLLAWSDGGPGSRDPWLRLAPAGRFVSDAVFSDLMAAVEVRGLGQGGRR